MTEPYYRSLETVGRTIPLVWELGLAGVWVVANKIREPRDESAILEYCAKRGFEVLGTVPFDPGITEADQVGRALIDYAPTAPAVAAVADLADKLTSRLGMIKQPGRPAERAR